MMFIRRRGPRFETVHGAPGWKESRHRLSIGILFDKFDFPPPTFLLRVYRRFSILATCQADIEEFVSFSLCCKSGLVEGRGLVDSRRKECEGA